MGEIGDLGRGKSGVRPASHCYRVNSLAYEAGRLGCDSVQTQWSFQGEKILLGFTLLPPGLPCFLPASIVDRKLFVWGNDAIAVKSKAYKSGSKNI